MNRGALAPSANSVGLPLQKIGPFSRENGPGIAASPAVVREAFSEELIQDGTVRKPIEIAPGHSVVLRDTGHTPQGAEEGRVGEEGVSTGRRVWYAHV